MRRPIRTEAGAATTFGIALMGLLLCLTVACCAAASLIATHRRAEAAADLAALAGAAAVQAGGDACGAASRVAQANQAELDSCEPVGADVTVRVRVPVAPVFGAGLHLDARARAGPVEATGAGLIPTG